ncbi:MAG: cytochrome c oxidase subunit II [Solirubrobacterales bacterium]
MKASHRIIAIAVTALLTVALIVFSLEYDWFGPLIDSGNGRIDTVYKALLIASIPFFMIICGILAFILFEFRAKPEDPDDKDGAPFHGSTKIEIVWTVIPTIVVVALGLYAWTVLDKVEAAQPNSMTIKVIGQQFAWNYQYPEQGIKTGGDLVVPINRPIYAEMTSADVIHSFYIPAARVKRDVADGFTTRIRFKTNKLGSYPIVCAELCGIGHATMRGTLRVVTAGEFARWVALMKSDKAPKPTGANTDPKTWPGYYGGDEPADTAEDK